MAEKILQTRIQLKYDTYTNWLTANPILKKGEMAVATIGATPTQVVDSVTAPQVILKVGDNKTAYKDLPFASALAADVYNWAKTTAPVLENQTINFKDAKGNVVHSIDLSDFVTNGELTSILTGYQPKGNYKTVQTAVEDKITDKAHVLDSLTQNANGEISYTVKKLTPADIGAQSAGDYKTQQTDYTASGSTTKTITKVTQNANGEISVTYGDIAFPAVTHPTVDDTEVKGSVVTEVDQTNGAIDVKRKAIDVSYDSKNRKIQLKIGTELIGEGFDASDFIKDGMIKSVELVDADGEGNPGKFLKITWNTPALDDADTITYVDLTTLIDVYTAGTGISVEGKVISHADTSSVANVTKTDRTYVAGITFDNFGHVTAIETATESDQDLSGYKTKQAAVAEKGSANKTLKISQNENGEITATEVNISIPHTQVNDWEKNIGIKSISADTGLKINTTGAEITSQTPQIAIDDSVTFILDCGSATNVI